MFAKTQVERHERMYPHGRHPGCHTNRDDGAEGCCLPKILRQAQDEGKIPSKHEVSKYHIYNLLFLMINFGQIAT